MGWVSCNYTYSMTDFANELATETGVPINISVLSNLFAMNDAAIKGDIATIVYDEWLDEKGESPYHNIQRELVRIFPFVHEDIIHDIMESGDESGYRKS